MRKTIEVQIEPLFLKVFLLDYLVMKQVGRLIGPKGGEIRYVIAALWSSVVGTIGIYISFFSPYVRLPFVVVCMVLSLVIVLGQRRLTYYLAGFAIAFITGVFLIGFLQVFELYLSEGQKALEITMYFVMAIWFGGLFFRKGMSFMKELTLHRSQHAKVTLKVQGREATCLGFWDSGNSLKDPISKRAVVLLEKSIMEKHHIPIPVKGFRVIPYNSIGMDHGVLKGFVADELTIQEESGYERTYAKVIVAIYEGKLSLRDDYQMLLNTHLE